MENEGEELNLFDDSGDLTGVTGDDGGEGEVSDNDDSSGALEIAVDEDGNPIPDVESSDGEGEGEGEPAAGYVRVKQTDWENLNKTVDQFRGYMAAGDKPPRQTAPIEPVEPVRPAQPIQPQTQPRSGEELVEMLSSSVAEDLERGDYKGAAKKLTVTLLQAGYNNTQAQLRQQAPAVSEAIIDGYTARKESRDPLYDKVAPKFEAMLNGYDTSVMAGAPRKQVIETLDILWQRAKGDVMDDMYAENQSRKATAKTTTGAEPKNYGGGAGRATQQSVTPSRSMRIPPAWVEFAKKAGITDEKEIRAMFASQVARKRGGAA